MAGKSVSNGGPQWDICGGTTLSAKLVKKMHPVVRKWPQICPFGAKNDYFLPQMGHFGAIFTPVGAFFLANFASWVAPPQLFSCDIAFDPLLPSIWGLLGLLGFLCLMAKKCVFGPKLAIFGSFPYHWVQFSDDFCIYSSSPTCVPL